MASAGGTCPKETTLWWTSAIPAVGECVKALAKLPSCHAATRPTHPSSTPLRPGQRPAHMPNGLLAELHHSLPLAPLPWGPSLPLAHPPLFSEPGHSLGTATPSGKPCLGLPRGPCLAVNPRSPRSLSVIPTGLGQALAVFIDTCGPSASNRGRQASGLSGLLPRGEMPLGHLLG